MIHLPTYHQRTAPLGGDMLSMALGCSVQTQALLSTSVLTATCLGKYAEEDVFIEAMGLFTTGVALANTWSMSA